jgi:hypothetical protein
VTKKKKKIIRKTVSYKTLHQGCFLKNRELLVDFRIEMTSNKGITWCAVCLESLDKLVERIVSLISGSMVTPEARDLAKRGRHQRTCVDMKVRSVGVRRVWDCVAMYVVSIRERGLFFPVMMRLRNT